MNGKRAADLVEGDYIGIVRRQGVETGRVVSNSPSTTVKINRLDQHDPKEGTLARLIIYTDARGIRDGDFVHPEAMVRTR